MTVSAGLVIVVGLFLPAASFCQRSAVTGDDKEAAKATAMVSTTIDLTHVASIPGLPASTVMGYPLQCTSAGSVYIEVYADSGSETVAQFPSIYRISTLRNVAKISIPTPLEYKQAGLLSLYPSEESVTALIQVGQPKSPDVQEPRGTRHFFISRVNSGGATSIAELHLPFTPLKVAAFDSGSILVLGVDEINLHPSLALVHSDGTMDRMLDLDSRTYKSSRDLQRSFSPKPGDTNTTVDSRQVLGAARSAQFIPWGSAVLLIQPGSKLPVYVFRDSGKQDVVQVDIPKGLLLASILGSTEKDHWIVRARSADSFDALAQGHVVENAPEEVFDVNPFTGESLRRFVIKGPQPGELTCAANGQLSAIYYGLPPHDGAAEQLTYSSSPW